MRKFFVLFFVIIAVATAKTKYEAMNEGNPNSEITANAWAPVNFVTDTNYVLKVTFKEAFLGLDRVYYCRAVFFNGSQYKLIAPWIDVTINMENILNKQVVKERKEVLK